MGKHVVLILERDMGDYSDEEDGHPISTNPKDWEDSFYQSDAVLSDFDIVGVRIEERE